MKEFKSTFEKIFEIIFPDVSNPQYTRSVSLSTLKVTGQYYNEAGEKVKNITDASKLIISEYGRTETVELFEGGIKIRSGVKIGEYISTTTFEVIDSKFLSLIDTDFDSVSKTKEVNSASDQLLEVVKKELSENEFNLNMTKKQYITNDIENQMKQNYEDLQRESRMDEKI